MQGLAEHLGVRVTCCLVEPGVSKANDLFNGHDTIVNLELNGKRWLAIQHTKDNEVLLLAYTFGVVSCITDAVAYGLTPRVLRFQRTLL